MDEKPAYNTTDIPVLPLPFDPRKDSSYSIALPSRYNDDGTNVVISYPADVPMVEAVTEIRNNFKRNSADTQWQMMLPPTDQFHLATPATVDDYKQWKEDKHLYEDGYNTDLSDLAIDAAKDLVKGIYSAGKDVVGVLSSSDDKEMGRHAFNLVEAAMRGTENFSSLVAAGEMFLKKKALNLVGSPEADQADYDAFTYMKGMAQQMAARSAGDMITEGGSAGMFGQLPGGQQLLSAVQKDPNVPAASPEDIKNINNASMILDPSWAIPIPGMQILEKAGAKMAANTIARNFLPSVLATEVAPRMAFGAMAKGGQALDYVTRGIFNTLSGVVQGVSEGAVSDASKAAANALARTTVYGTAMVTGGGGLVKTALVGKAARALGEVGLAVLEGTEKGSARMAVQELSENMATSAAVRASARAALKIMPPDSAFNAMKGVANAAVHSGLFMGGIGAMQADMAGDDPIRGFEEGFASGVGLGAVVGTGMIPKINEKANLERVARYFQDDSVGRSRERVFTATAPDGTRINIPINDMQGRVDLFNRNDIPLEQREMILAITRAHEKAGGEVFFHDGSEATREALQSAGLDAGKGFQIVDGADGRSIIVLDPNAVDFSAATAAEEVFHGMFTDTTAKEVWKGIGDALGTQDATAITGELVDFANKYISQLEASPGGKPHADKLRETLAAGTAPGLSDQQRISTLIGIINEYAANYVGAALAGMNPSKINQPQINNIWDKVWDKTTSNILSVFDRSKSGITKDPITGHFFDSGGRRIKTPAMEHIVERFVDAAREGHASIDPMNTVDGATYFDVKSPGSMQSVEDVVAGKQTTKTQKQKILAGWFADTVSAASEIDGSSAMIVTPELRDSGYIHGNLPADGKVVFFKHVMPDALVEHISNQVVNGQRVFANPSIPKLWNDAVAAKRIITLDSWHNISKTMGSRKDSYYARANRWVLPLGTQQMPKGGIEGAYLDVSRMWSNAKELMAADAATKRSFKEKGINTVEDFIPYIQDYFTNFSSANPVPTETLPGFTPEIRNAISKVLDLRQRSGYLAERDAGRFKNDNGFQAEFFRNLAPATVDIGGGRGKMKRESVTLASVRLDRINGINEFTLNGKPVTIPYTVEVPNLARANFSPGRARVEKLGDSTVITDTESGKRLIVAPNGKTKLFDGDKVSIHDSPEQAEDRANKNSVAQARFSPKGEEPFSPKVGDTVRASIEGDDYTVKVLAVHDSPSGMKYYSVDMPMTDLISELNIYPVKDKSKKIKGTQNEGAGAVETYKQFRDRIALEEKEALSKETKADAKELLDAMADKQQWASLIEQRAYAGERLPDAVLDSFRKEIGVDAFARTFRGQAEQKGYEPADVKTRSNKERKEFLEKKKEIRSAPSADTAIAVADNIENQHIAKLQKLVGNSRSTTASLIDAVEKMFADGIVSKEVKNSFISSVESPSAQKMKERKPVRQDALNSLLVKIGKPDLVSNSLQSKMAVYTGLLDDAKPYIEPGQQYDRAVHAAAKRLNDVIKHMESMPKESRDAAQQIDNLDIWADKLKLAIDLAKQSKPVEEPAIPTTEKSSVVEEQAPVPPPEQLVQMELELKPGGQDALESLLKLYSPSELEVYRKLWEKRKGEPMPGAEERLKAAEEKVKQNSYEEVGKRAIKKFQERKALENARTPSSLEKGPMEDMYHLIQGAFRKKPVVGKTPSSLESLRSLRADIERAFTPQIAERLVRNNPLVPKQEVPLAVETRTEAKRKRDNERALALVRKENEIRYKEEQRISKLEQKIEGLQERQRKATNADRAKEIANLLNERDAVIAEMEAQIKLEQEASKANQLMGEQLEAQARMRRTAKRASEMEQLLKERDAEMAAPTKPAAPQIKVDSSVIPPGVELFKTKSGKFRVFLSSGQAIGITDEYKDAVKLAQRYATKTLSNRKSFR